MKHRTRESSRRRRGGWIAGALLPALLCLLPRAALGAAASVSAGDTRFSNGSRVVYHKGYGYWAFYSNGSEFVYRFSPDGVNFTTAETEVVQDESGGQNPGEMGSVYHLEVTSRVFVLVGDGDPPISPPGTPYNKLFLKRGTLQPDGTISWGSLFERGLNCSMNSWPGQHRAGMSGGIALLGTSESGSISYAAGGWSCEVSGGNCRQGRDYFGFIGQTGASAGGTFSGATTVCGADNNKDSPNPTQVFAGVVAVNDGGTWKTIVAYRDDKDSARWFFDLYNGATYEVQEMQFNTVDTNFNTEGYGVSMVSEPNSSVVHVAYVDGLGNLVYARRASAGNWPVKNVLIDDAGGTATETNAVKHPAIAFLENGASDEIVVVYVMPNGDLKYARGSTSINSPAGWTYTTWKTGAGHSWPTMPRMVTVPDPIPVAYTVGGNVVFDRIITSSNPDPTVSAITPDTVGAGAGIVDASVDTTYDIELSGTGFIQTPGVSFQRGGATLGGVTVTSVTWIADATKVRVHFSVDQTVPPGPFDLEVVNPDARSGLK
ncbi:MAG: hypothetical protein CO113_13645, partial [Elusimicrobia bacterium CG_4_9_14_3_um_filter_62_55]